ncbi:MAG: type II toxin-antitoxin system VapC family toxin [Chloroflexi bacterium]|nr:type II toxin-antitoxin system VapC family toxin [Chloroflexota bacterium]
MTSEAGADFMRILLEESMADDVFCLSSFGVLEVNAAIRRRLRNEDMENEAIRKFGQDSVSLFRVIPTDDDLLRRALFVVENYRLRAGDAIHLTSSLSIAAFTDSAQVIMISSDAELIDTSIAAGIGALDPQADDAMDSLRQIRE